MGLSWKVTFNTDPNKYAIKDCFSDKRNKENYRLLEFNSTDVQLADSQKN